MPKIELKANPVPLYQVFVEDDKKGVIPVGPRWAKRLCERMAESIAIAIKQGKITGWRDPHVVRWDLALNRNIIGLT